MLWVKLQLAALRHFSILGLFLSILQAWGILWLIVEPLCFFFPSFTQIARDWWLGLSGGGIIAGLWWAWPSLSVKSQIAGTDAEIEIRVCDLFEQAGTLVVSSNTTFDTAMEDGTISKTSTQGQYTTRFCAPLEDLDRQIAARLDREPFKSLTPNIKPYGKTKAYPIGTVAPVTCGGKSAYFVAIARLNANRNASADREDILDALPKLWEFVRTRGDLAPIAMPIVGTGFARVAATREELIREIVKSFIAAAHAGRFCEHLTIAISEKDFREKKIILPRLGSFLEHECTYTYDSRSIPSTPHGLPAGGENPTLEP